MKIAQMIGFKFILLLNEVFVTHVCVNTNHQQRNQVLRFKIMTDCHIKPCQNRHQMLNNKFKFCYCSLIENII
jgi:hypothetical protein